MKHVPPEIKSWFEKMRYKAMERMPYLARYIQALIPYVTPELRVKVVKDAQGKDQWTGVPMAVTDDWIVLISPDLPKVPAFFDIDKSATVYCHELMHLWNDHSRRREALNIPATDSYAIKAWRWATDMEINDDLEGANFPMPAGVHPRQIGEKNGETAEYYYKAIMAKRPEIKLECVCGSGQGEKIDAEDGIEIDAEALPTEEEAELRIQAISDAIHSAHAQGHHVPPSMLDRANATRARKAAKVDWRQQIRHLGRRVVAYVQGDQETNSGRLARIQYSTSYIRFANHAPRAKARIVYDTSASMINLIGTVHAETDALLEALGCEVETQQVDQEILKDAQGKTIQTIRKASDVVFRGLRGTYLRPVFDALVKEPMGKRPDILVFITDGEDGGTMRTCPAPKGTRVIWAIIGHGPKPAPWGDLVRILA